jgi:hypothetical protein
VGIAADGGAVKYTPACGRRLRLTGTADQVDELRGRSDRDLLDEWFMAFTLHRKEIQSARSRNGLVDYSTRPESFGHAALRLSR